jgi:ribosomal protein S12 methylthiotransferase accessory factor
MPAIPGVDHDMPKAYRGETHRTVSPAETVARLKRLMPMMGITRVANLTGLDRIGIPVIAAMRPNSRSVAVSQGKGLTLDAAKASGLMESIEGYHAENITLPLKLGSYRELVRTHNLIELEGLPWVRNSNFRAGLRMLWIEGHDLIQQERVWVPYELAHTDYTMTQIGGGCFMGGSNGLASGNHLLEATSHAIHEMIERHCTTLWQLRGNDAMRNTRIDLTTVDDPACLEVLEKYKAAAVDVMVWDCTDDPAIPVFACAIVDNQENAPHNLYINWGMGCHPTRQIALLRALTEAAQTRLTFISGARDDVTRSDYKTVTNPELLTQFREWMRENPPVRSFAAVPSWENATFGEDISMALDRLQSIGVQRAILINLTKLEFGIPVARMIIPGLETPFDLNGFVPGRAARAILQNQSQTESQTKSEI